MTVATVPLAVPVVGDAEINAAVRVLRSGHLVQGREVAAFEQDFSALIADEPDLMPRAAHVKTGS